MSDHSQGEGWWLASDGKWYPPESQPGRALPPPPTAGTVGGTEPAPDKPKSRKGFWILLAMVVGGIWVVALLGDSDSDSTLDGDEWEAHAMCADFTRDRLKAPGTADFPEYDDRGVTITNVGPTWTVRSFVDSDNSFGANIRMSFTCVVRDIGERWRLEDWSER